MTIDRLKLQSRKSLEAMARRRGIGRWHSLTKPELVRALARLSRAKAASATPRSRVAVAKSTARRTTKSRAAALRRNRRNGSSNGEHVPRDRDLCTTAIADRNSNGVRNALEASVCDGQWLRATWDLTRDSIRRAQSRLAAEWHQAIPTIRVFAVSTDDVNTASEVRIKDISIETGVDTWYVHVPPEHHTYRLHIGYRTPKGTFFVLAKSNLCQMPSFNADLGSGENDTVSSHSRNGAEHAGSHDARLGRPLGFSSLSHFGPAASVDRDSGEFCFQLDTELIVHGTTRPGSKLTLQGEPVVLRDDGTFTIRLNQPEGRQLVTFTALSPRGGERRMVILAVERNTKELERQYFDGGHSEGYTDSE